MTNESSLSSKFSVSENILLITIFLVVSSLSFTNFLLFHSLIELFSIIVAFTIFIIAIYSKNQMRSFLLVFLGIAYGYVGLFDLIHTLTYKGMGVFPGVTSNLPTQLWIMGRFLEAIALAAAFYLVNKNIEFDYRYILLIFTIISLVGAGLILFGVFPACFIEGQGLTRFKVIGEYVISFILIIALYFLRQNRDNIGDVYQLISYSIILTIFSEISFIFYIDVYGFSNIVGHLLKLISFYLIFKAVVETGFKKPYQLLFYNLTRQKNELSKNQIYLNSIINAIPDIIILLDKQGKYLDVWTSQTDDLVQPREELIGKTVKEVLSREAAGKFMENIRLTLNKKEVQSFEYRLEIGGEKKYFEANINSMDVTGDEEREIIATVRNITDRKKAEERIRYLSFHDQLTGLFNRRYFENELERLSLSRRLPISIIVGDLDNLKYVNDNYGHKTGDKFIQKAAEIFNSVTRKEDVVARIGGDEFAIILPETDSETVQAVCERLRKKCQKCRDEQLCEMLNISLGCATMTEKEQDLNTIFNIADQKMYENKGRSRR